MCIIDILYILRIVENCNIFTKYELLYVHVTSGSQPYVVEQLLHSDVDLYGPGFITGFDFVRFQIKHVYVL